jgi:hypothetical protein
MTAPVVSIDFEPDACPEGWSCESASSTALTSELQYLGISFFTEENSLAIDDWFREILVDLIRCLYLSRQILAHRNLSLEPERERWLYLKVQALSCRLLARTQLTGIQAALRIATMLFILSITDYVGARVTALLLLPKLQNVLEGISLETSSPDSQQFPGLIFWMSSLGALVSRPAARIVSTDPPSPKTSLHNRQADFFSFQTARAAYQIGLEANIDKHRSFLQTYLYLDVNGGDNGSELRSLVETIARIDQELL